MPITDADRDLARQLAQARQRDTDPTTIAATILPLLTDTITSATATAREAS